MRVLLILDRDGTIIKNDDWIGKDADWRNKIVLNKAIVSFLSSLKDEYKTTMIVVTNQAGVARRCFDENRVKEVNAEVNKKLSALGIEIASWQYAPCVDASYARTKPEIDWNNEYVKPETTRKPSTKMVQSALHELGVSLKDFDTVCVMGDRHEDSDLATNLSVPFIDVNRKTIQDLISDFNAVLSGKS